MQRLSIARSLRLALIGLTVVLAVIAALGVASLYASRQHYEDTLARSSSAAINDANRLTAEIAGLAHRPALATRAPGQASEQARLPRQVSAARAKARSDSRRAIVLVALAVALALVAALALITVLVGAMRRAARRARRAPPATLAGGQTSTGESSPPGPRELRDLGAAFNAMGEDLDAAQRQLEEERAGWR